MVSRAEVDRFLETLYLNEKCQDRSMNGLQVQGADAVRGFCLGVDACLDLFREAAARDLNYIVVHHGFFWGQPFPISGLWLERFRFLLEHGLSLFAMHLPMDIHPELGHNILMARELGLEEIRPFGAYKGVMLGFQGELSAPREPETFFQVLRDLFPEGVTILPFGGARISRVGIISGAGGSHEFLEEAARAGLDLLVTGETSHAAFHPAKELRLHVAFCGHYQTEKWSLVRLRQILADRFRLPAAFVSLPTSL